MASRDPDLSDLGAALAGIVPPVAALDVTAAFFHRTFARWLGLPEGRSPGKKQPPQWDYDFWKAELVDDGVIDDKRTFTARVFRRPDGAAESYRYWLKIDAVGRIKSSGWMTAAPDLLGSEPKAFAPAPALDPGALQALFVDE